VFSGWFFDNETFGREVFLDSTPIVSSITIYAKWEAEVQNIPVSPAPPSENITIQIPEVTVTYPVMFKSGRAVAYLNEDGSVTAGLNHTGSVNSEATIAALKEAIRMARANGKNSVKIIIPKEAIGFSERTADKIRKEARGFKVEFEIEFTEDLTGTLELTENVGQVLTDAEIALVRRDLIDINLDLDSDFDLDIDIPHNDYPVTPIGEFIIIETAQSGGFLENVRYDLDMNVDLEKLFNKPDKKEGWQKDESGEWYYEGAVPFITRNNDTAEVSLIPITIADGVISFSTDSGWFAIAVDGTVIENVNN
jgi:hypothetical protein